MTTMKQFTATNKRILKMAIDRDIDYCRTYTNYGPRVRRIKLWALSWQMPLKKIHAFCKDLEKLTHVNIVEVDDARYTSTRSLYVYYK